MRTISIRPVLLAAGVVAGVLAGVTLPAGQAQAQVYVQIGPPAPRVEVVPQPRAGWVWTPGYYEWRRGRYVWIGGAWVRERPGYAYVAPVWVQEGNRWVYRPSRWDRDRDWNQRRHGPRYSPPPPHRRPDYRSDHRP